jgi:transcriptional regulator with XRE-family HTH domain
MSPVDTSLATTLRTWRDRLSPPQLGTGTGGTRRAAGLRREELAELAGLSVDYLVRLEQGRATTPSAPVVAALAHALRLSRTERDHFYRLAGLQPPGDQAVSERISPGVQRVLQRLGDVAVAVFTADWRLLWWNGSWSALLGDPSGTAPEDRSFVYARFPVPGRRGFVPAWPVHSERPEATDRAVVADLRRVTTQYPDDPHLAELLTTLLEGSPDFARLWRAGAVGEYTGDRKTVEHPLVGEIVVDCDVLSTGEDGLRIVVMTVPAGSPDALKLAQVSRAGEASVPG